MPRPWRARLRGRSLLLIISALSLAAPTPARAGGYGGRFLQIVWPGQSIQDAVDHARPGGFVFVLPGVYRENANATNGLSLSQGIHLVGVSTARKRVVLENAGGQRNGIVAVPAEHTDCMGCHTDLAPPFPLKPGVDANALAGAPTIYGLTVSGITIRGFTNNGFFARNLDGFAIVDVHSEDQPNYGIFPVSSKNGIITRSSATGANDSGIWVETSEKVQVTHNVVERNVNGFEISNSDDILIAYNEIHGNSIGVANLFLPDIFDVRPDARRITIRDNHIHDNNKPNTAPPGVILATVPSGIGILHLGVDDSLIASNVVERNDFVGIAIVDYCAAVIGGNFDCSKDPDVTPGFVADNEASNNRVVNNVATGNGANPDPTSQFAAAASDLGLLTFGDHGNCYAGNVYDTFFSLLGELPACP